MILSMNDPSSSMICLLILHDGTYDSAMLPIDVWDVTKLFFFGCYLRPMDFYGCDHM